MRGKLPYFCFTSLKCQGKDLMFLAVDLLDFNIQFIHFFTFQILPYRNIDCLILMLLRILGDYNNSAKNTEKYTTGFDVRKMYKCPNPVLCFSTCIFVS